jgi:pimeloyl-ACP methyl ester carboxylesterase
MREVRHAFVETRGFPTHVAEAGRGAPLLLLHGWPEFWATWEPMFERLPDRFRLIAPDFRGFGESGNPTTGASDQAGPDVLADDIVALLRVAGLFFFNCGTHGVGGRWRDPGQINEIWYQTFHQMPFAPAIVGASRDTCRAYFRHFLTHWCHRKDAFDGVLERWVDNFMRPGNLQGGFNWYISQNAGRLAVMAGTAPKPPMITQPTRVLWGRHDPVLKSAWIDVVGNYFENVEAGIAEEAGHFVHYEQPDLAAAEIAKFFERIGYRV